MRFKERFSAAISRSVEIARFTAQAISEFVSERVWPVAKQFGDWFTLRASQAARSIASAARSATGVFPYAIGFVVGIASGALRAFAGGASGAAKTTRSTTRLAVQAVVAWFFPLLLLEGLMGNAFFRPHNLFPILLIVWVVIIGVIWLSRRGQQAQ